MLRRAQGGPSQHAGGSVSQRGSRQSKYYLWVKTFDLFSYNFLKGSQNHTNFALVNQR